MIFRLNSTTVAEETKKSEMENSTIDHKRNHILDPNFETYHSLLQFKQLRNNRKLKTQTCCRDDVYVIIFKNYLNNNFRI